MKPKILTTLRTYDVGQFRGDLIAGVTVALVALPLSLAIAIASGAGPEKGLVTAVIAGFLISLLGGSRVQIGGPTGAFIVVVGSVIAQHGYDGLVLATGMAGLILLAAGFLRVGNLISYIPEAVVDGFTIGIAIIIATSQLKDVFGLEVSHLPLDFLHKLPIMWAARGTFSLPAFGIGILTIALIVIARRIAPKWPGLILAIMITSAIVALLNWPVDTISSRFGTLPSSLPLPALPQMSLTKIIEVLPSAWVIAFLAGVESLLSAMVADRMLGSRHRSNAEVIAQGAANLGSSLFGGMPATGAIARTATNIRAGGWTPVAGIIHALTVFLFILLAMPLAGHLAMPALAGLLLLTAWNMAEPQRWRSHLSAPNEHRLLLLLTLVLTVVADLTIAIGVGVAAGLALRLRHRKAPPADWDVPER